jgi:regulator of protease activity HflC (stomatin/prohibitin superfamily)
VQVGVIEIILVAAAAFLVALILFKSLKYIGPTDVGLVTKRFGAKLKEGSVLAMQGEAGFQHALLMPGWRFKLWPIFSIREFPWVQVPAGEIGVVIAQVGAPLPVGAKSAVYRAEFGDFGNVETFLGNGGGKGVQRPVLPPGTLAPIHPVAFMVITSRQVYGLPVSTDLAAFGMDGKLRDNGELRPQSFGLDPNQLRVTQIGPVDGVDMVGIVYALEGDPLQKGDIASRLGGYEDVKEMEAAGASVAEVMEVLLGNKNNLHNNYQDFQGFLDQGGRIGLQHDPLLPGAYLLNPFLIRVDLVPMTVVEQGEVNVVMSYVGLPTEDMSGEDFKFGSIVKPGHKGIWSEPLRTGKYPLNPHCYGTIVVPTSILTLNWANATSEAHDLDKALSPIDGKSREGFEFSIDLQVQIHVPDVKAPKVISMVGSMQNLVNEVLQSAVGNHFRNRLQGLPAVTFIETRDAVQKEAEEYIVQYLARYDVETRGVYIQDVDLPQQLVEVLTAREIANQQKATFVQERQAQDERVLMEKSRGIAEQQAQLAASQVAIDIAANGASAKKAEADGIAAYTVATGTAEANVIKAKGEGEAAAVKAIGLARAAGYDAQVQALGQGPTALVAVANEISDGKIKVVPDVLVTGGGGSIEGLAATLMQQFGNGSKGNGKKPEHEARPEPPAKKEAPRSGTAPGR